MNYSTKRGLEMEHRSRSEKEDTALWAVFNLLNKNVDIY